MKALAFSLGLMLLSSTAFGQGLTEVLKENQELYESFFKDSQESVAKEAQELAKLVKKSKASELKEVEAKIPSLEKINKKNSKDKNLVLYGEFLPSLVKVVKSKNTKNYEVFYCPMVEKKWIQNVKINKDVKNVFAQKMISCGGKDE